GTERYELTVTSRRPSRQQRCSGVSSPCSVDPAITHAVYGLHGVELGINALEFPADAFDVRGDGVVIQHNVGCVHELLSVLDMAGVPGQRIDDPELREGKEYDLALPLYLHALGIQCEWAAPHDLSSLGRAPQCIDSPEECIHARDEMSEAQVLCQEVVSSQPQSGYGIQLTVAGRQEDDRQLCRQGAQLAAQLEAALRLLLQGNVDDREVRKTRCEGS